MRCSKNVQTILFISGTRSSEVLISKVEVFSTILWLQFFIYHCGIETLTGMPIDFNVKSLPQKVFELGAHPSLKRQEMNERWSIYRAGIRV